MAIRLALAVLLAPLLQAAVADRLPWPGGAGPDLVLAVAVVAGAVHGPLTGTVAGFCGGLALDLSPPSDHVAGRTALVLCVLGYACGAVRRPPRPAVAAAGALAGTLALPGLDALLGDPRITWSALAHTAPPAVAYTLAMIVPVWLALAGRTATRMTDATSLPLSPVRGASARGLALSRLVRPPVAGAGSGRGPLRPRRRRGSRAPDHRAGGARPHRR
ncbi:rod shape-determining protein MreD [Bailinhaonella thermotolerans]|uniref:rod shape-determining protein MreD n=1 Tax=Bailinhaonella thermotolerans TaxID=1070861 RepID=UPI001F5B2757|nr:rod shape-determining protein MreD [Bailinhaonella thermotolerans]